MRTVYLQSVHPLLITETVLPEIVSPEEIGRIEFLQNDPVYPFSGLPLRLRSIARVKNGIGLKEKSIDLSVGDNDYEEKRVDRVVEGICGQQKGILIFFGMI